MARLTESEVEDAALAWFEELGYAVAHGPELPEAERPSTSEFLLNERIKQALYDLNPDVPRTALDEAHRKLANIATLTPRLIDVNHRFHHFLIHGVPVEYLRDDGSIGYVDVRIVDFDNPTQNDWLVVNQFTITQPSGHGMRRPDLVVFVNGLPLAIFEFKNAANENATIWAAYDQLQTYKREFPELFGFNELMIVSDGPLARIGTISAEEERFAPWRTIDSEELAPAWLTQLEVMIRGVFEYRRFLDLLRFHVVFETSDDDTVKKLAGYHQFHAVSSALAAALAAAKPGGDQRAGVVWHTQGSGKSLTMVFLAGRLILHPDMANPTIVVLTDRNDLDDQLFGTFSRCHELLRQRPEQASSRKHLRKLLAVASGGVVFTTVQKFMPEPGERYPELSPRPNIVVIADEAHRSQYDFIDGYARHMRDALPNASFIGFTGTPLDNDDKNTRNVFGEYVSVYDIQRAVDDGATVPIYYESRLAKLALRDEERPRLDFEFDDITEGEELEGKEKLKSKWSQLEALVGAEHRLDTIAADLIEHFEARQAAMPGKAMIVCMSRRICAALYQALIARRPDWHGDGDEAGKLKVVITGSSSDKPDLQIHLRTKKAREELAKRFKDPNDPFEIVIVRDMWLTGFDAPCLHTMYIDKPMRGHAFMQAIARVNRVFRDKPGGLVVDYLGLAHELKLALHTYTASGGKGSTAIDQAEAVAVMLAKYEVCCELLHGFDWSAWAGRDARARLSLLPAAQEHVLAQEAGKERFMKAVTELSKAFALAVPHDDALRIRDDVAFFQTIRAGFVKLASSASQPRRDDYDHAIRQIVSRAVASEDVVDIFAAVGLAEPNIAILSDEFLAEVADMEHRNLAVELLRKLLADEIKHRSRTHLVQSRSFALLLEQAILRYQNRAIETAQVIGELIELAKQLRAAGKRGEALGLSSDEAAFYEALEVNDSAVAVLGDAALCKIARELVHTVRRNVTIDWTLKDSVKAKLRVMVKRVLKKHGYPPDKAEQATHTVLEQASLFSDHWAPMA